MKIKEVRAKFREYKECKSEYKQYIAEGGTDEKLLDLLERKLGSKHLAKIALNSIK